MKYQFVHLTCSTKKRNKRYSMTSGYLNKKSTNTDHRRFFSLQLIIYFVLLKIFFFNRTINFKKEKTIDMLKDLYTEAVYWFSSQNVLLANRHSKGSWFHAYIFNVLRVTGGYPLWPLITVLLPGFLKKQLFIQRLSLRFYCLALNLLGVWIFSSCSRRDPVNLKLIG